MATRNRSFRWISRPQPRPMVPWPVCWTAKPNCAASALKRARSKSSSCVNASANCVREVHGLEEQQKSVTGQLRIADQELEDLKPLQERGTVRRPRISGLEREVLRNQGFLGDTLAKIVQSQAKIAETELQIVQSDNDFISDVIKDLRETGTKITELQERRITAEDQLRRLEIRAPISGIVHQLNVHTIGGVISPSETLMLIVPYTDRLIVEVRISP
jgi:membrane fusion protein, type I secretion system